MVAGRGRLLTGLYNLYVYFWRWAVWKVLEHQTMDGPGVISFISASSYLEGDAFCGMREHLRRQCDELWIIDLGGEGRGTRRSDNVFAIQTPVAIAVALRSQRPDYDEPARIHYARIEGERHAKLARLDDIADFVEVNWQDCPDGWHAPFRPAGTGDYFAWPLVKDLFPWQQPGVKTHRPWLIAESEETLVKRWKALLYASDRAEAFHENGERRVNSVRLSTGALPGNVADLPENAPIPPVHRYAFRSFDRQHIIADIGLMIRPRPPLWQAHGDPAQTKQMYMTTLMNHPLGAGPGATACSHIPDMHHYRGSYGGKDVVPLYRAADASEANILPGLLDLLAEAYHRIVTPEDFLAYVYGVLAHPAFTARFHKELEKRELRVPMTKDALLFEQARHIGARLLWLHTYGERFVPDGQRRGVVPPGMARCIGAISGDADGYPESYEYNDATRSLRVGDGGFAPVTPEVFEFEVSGLKVVQSWLKYRMKNGAGRKSSPLDDIRPERWTSQLTTELLELLWVLEATVSGYPEQAALLDDLLASACFGADEFPSVPDDARNPPAVRPSDPTLFDTMEEQ